MRTQDSRPRPQLTASRRSVFTSFACLLGLFALGAASAPSESRSLVRPPRAADDFLARCLRCGRCHSVCPRDVVTTTDLDAGLINLRTPVMDFRRGYCDFCGKCVEVCPSAALLPFKKPEVKIGRAELTDSCIALRTSACTKCHEACPEKAISLSPRNEPVIDSTKCNGCGKCVLVCPANVFQSFGGNSLRGIEINPIQVAERKP